MEKIEAFKLSDGRIIDNEVRAIELQKEIDIKKKLTYFCEKFLMDLEYFELADEIYLKRVEFLSAFGVLSKEENSDEILADSGAINKATHRHDVSGMLCGSFDPDNGTSSATKCKCGREKWEH